MSETGPEFNFQTILIACEIQNDTLEETAKQESDNVEQYQQHLKTYKEKVKKLEENLSIYQKMKLERNEMVKKLNKTCQNRASNSYGRKTLQKNISDAFENLQHESTEFVNVTRNKEEALKKVYAQFEGDILQNLIREYDSKLTVTDQTKLQLSQQFNELKNNPTNFHQYESCSILRNLYKCVHSQEEINTMKAEIQILTKKHEVNTQKIQDLKKRLH